MSIVLKLSVFRTQSRCHLAPLSLCLAHSKTPEQRSVSFTQGEKASADMAKVALEQNLGASLLEEPSAKKPCLQTLRVKCLSEHAKLPVRGSALAAGYDISSARDVVIPARGKAMVHTDLALAIPSGCYGRVAPRSGLAWKHSIDTGAGVIDEDYRGPLGVILFNFSDEDFQVKCGDRIAQLILERIYTPEVEQVEDLDATARGAGAFGSTGGFNSENRV